MKKSELKYIVNHFAKNVSLPDFIEKEIPDAKIKWSRDMDSGLGNCPFDDHSDRNASFRVGVVGDGVGVFNCFGCGKHGTIVDFCKEYFGLKDYREAVVFLCKKYNIQNTEDLIVQGITSLSKRVDMQRICENENIRVSNLCRMLLRKAFDKNKVWVSKAYKSLNEAMDKEDIDAITTIGEKASKKLMEKKDETKI
jgi:hypothetical protein